MNSTVTLAQHILFMWYGAHLINFSTGKQQQKDRLYFKARGLVAHDRILHERKNP